MSRFFKNRELDDAKIKRALRKAIKDYENGEIIEVKSILVDIINSITDFEECMDELNYLPDLL